MQIRNDDNTTIEKNYHLLRQHALQGGEHRDEAEPILRPMWCMAWRPEEEAYRVLDAGDRSDAVANLRESEGI